MFISLAGGTRPDKLHLQAHTLQTKSYQLRRSLKNVKNLKYFTYFYYNLYLPWLRPRFPKMDPLKGGFLYVASAWSSIPAIRSANAITKKTFVKLDAIMLFFLLTWWKLMLLWRNSRCEWFSSNKIGAFIVQEYCAHVHVQGWKFERRKPNYNPICHVLAA